MAVYHATVEMGHLVNIPLYYLNLVRHNSTAIIWNDCFIKCKSDETCRNMKMQNTSQDEEELVVNRVWI